MLLTEECSFVEKKIGMEEASSVWSDFTGFTHTEEGSFVWSVRRTFSVITYGRTFFCK